PDFEIPPDKTACQCVAGLNFSTLRPRFNILNDFRRVVREALLPENYFGRVLRLTLMQVCSRKRLKLPLRILLRDVRSLYRLTLKLGLARETRAQYWKVLFICLLRNPRALRNAVSLMALYLHFGTFRDFVLGRLDTEIDLLKKEGDPREKKVMEKPFSVGLTPLPVP